MCQQNLDHEDIVWRKGLKHIYNDLSLIFKVLPTDSQAWILSPLKRRTKNVLIALNFSQRYCPNYFKIGCVFFHWFGFQKPFNHIKFHLTFLRLCSCVQRYSRWLMLYQKILESRELSEKAWPMIPISFQPKICSLTPLPLSLSSSMCASFRFLCQEFIVNHFLFQLGIIWNALNATAIQILIVETHLIGLHCHLENPAMVVASKWSKALEHVSAR